MSGRTLLLHVRAESLDDLYDADEALAHAAHGAKRGLKDPVALVGADANPAPVEFSLWKEADGRLTVHVDTSPDAEDTGNADAP
ncbi:MAG: hypothetical protein RIB84_23760 [Sneathiellaceae bacterium]